MNNLVSCPTCEYEYNHFLASITVEVPEDDYNAAAISVNINNENYRIRLKSKYPYRSQGNIHLLFYCEQDHYHFISYDGHKGHIFVNENSLIDDLSTYINSYSDDSKSIYGFGKYKLLSIIEEFAEALTISSR
jgi:hypothetical protein